MITVGRWRKPPFHGLNAACYLPDYKLDDIYEFTQDEINEYQKTIRSTPHLIMQFSQQGGFENASGL